jgi:hypothetical protein
VPITIPIRSNRWVSMAHPPAVNIHLCYFGGAASLFISQTHHAGLLCS